MFALVVTVTAAVVVFGGQSIADAKSDTARESATGTMLELQSEATQAGSGERASRQITFTQATSRNPVAVAGGSARRQEGGRVSIDETAGEVSIEVDDGSDGESSVQVLENEPLGAVVYRENGEKLVYQGGGVFRQTAGREEAVVVSPPAFEYQYRSGIPTLSMRFTTLSAQSDGDAGNSFSVRPGVSTGLLPSDSLPSPLEADDSIVITVESEYYRAWEEFFREQTAASVTTNDFDGDGTTAVRVTLDGQPAVGETIDGAVTSSSGTAMTNVGQVDSYQSSDGPYPGWRAGDNGKIAVDDGVSLSESPVISGDLVVTEDFYVANTPVVYGRTITGGTPGTGSVDQIDSSAAFRGTFSTTDDLDLMYSSGSTFGDDLIVGGALDEFGAARVDGTVHVHETARLDRGDTADLYGDVISDGDVYVNDNVNLHDADAEIVTDESVVVRGGTHDVDVVAGGDVEIRSGATVNGDVDAGGNVYVDGSHSGTVVAGGVIDGASGTEHGSPTPPDMDRLRVPLTPSVDIPGPVDDDIDDNGTRLAADNDNADHATAVASIETGGCSSGCSLDAGGYHLSEMDIDQDGRLELDTTDGDVEMYLEDGAHVRGEVTVTGENDVRIYNDGNLTVEDSDAAVTTPNDDASQLWLFVNPDATVDVHSNSPLFTGIVFGPGSPGTTINVTNAATVKGALVGDVNEFSESASIHYDEALESASPVDVTLHSGDTVGYVQVSTSEVTIESG